MSLNVRRVVAANGSIPLDEKPAEVPPGALK